MEMLGQLDRPPVTSRPLVQEDRHSKYGENSGTTSVEAADLFNRIILSDSHL